jgi:hypothetical protein
MGKKKAATKGKLFTGERVALSINGVNVGYATSASVTERSEASSVGLEFPKEQARCREVLQQYRDIGPAGFFGVAMIEATLRQADQAMASGDIVAILQAFQAMKSVE